jgi:polysaccharide pyruvyl transferase WcaK-like protein
LIELHLTAKEDLLLGYRSRHATVWDLERDNARVRAASMKERVWILGYFGRNNLGDEMLLASVLDNRPDWAAPCVLTANERLTRETHGVSSVLCPPLYSMPHSGPTQRLRYWVRKGPRLLLDVLREKPCIFACGGSITDHVAGLVVRIRESVSNLKRLRCRVALLGAGIDPLTLPADRDAAAALIGHELAYCSVRDAKSAEVLRELGVPAGRFHEAVDLAYAVKMPIPSRQNVEPATMSSANIGLNLKPLFCTPQERGDDKASRFETYLQDCCRLVRRLQPKVGRLALVPFSREDHAFLSRISCECGAATLPFTPNPRRMLAEMAAFDGFVGMRYHSVVFSVLANTPVVPIVYAPKVDALAVELGFDSGSLAVGDGTEMVDRRLDVDTVCRQAEAVWHERRSHKERMAAIVERKRKRALKDMEDCWEAVRCRAVA